MSRKKTSFSKRNKKQDIDITEIKLPQMVDITSASDIKEMFMEAIESSQGNIVIDSSSVTKVTTPGVQVIIATAKMAESAGRKISILNAADAVREAFSVLHFLNSLSKPMSENAQEGSNGGRLKNNA